jgi:DNA-binding response OmpR family regulator
LLRRSKTERAPKEEQVSPAVLVVNDDEDVCELLCRILQSKGGLIPFRAHTSEGALEELESRKDAVSAVILDFSGGTATSFALLESIRQRADLSELAVIIVATTTANRVLAFDSGVDEFVTRPFHADDFVATVTTVLGRSPEERAEYRSRQALAGRGLNDLPG